MPLIERDITLTCVSNDVGGPYVGGARWLGVRLTDLLDQAGVGSKADQILSTDVDGFTISTPLDLATDGRDAMVAVGMNGEALPREHGFPVRLVDPRPLRLHQRHQVAHPADADDVRRAGRVLDRARLGDRRPDQDLQPDRHPEVVRGDRRRRHVRRRRRLGPAPRHREGRGPGRRRRVAARRARPLGRRRLLAPVVPALEGRLRRARPVRPRRRPRTARCRPRSRPSPFPEGSSGLQRIIVRVA